MTVSGVPFSVNVAPRAAGSLWKCRSQNSCEMTTTGLAEPIAVSGS
jgi:hypothetical protein